MFDVKVFEMQWSTDPFRYLCTIVADITGEAPAISVTIPPWHGRVDDDGEAFTGCWAIEGNTKARPVSQGIAFCGGVSRKVELSVAFTGFGEMLHNSRSHGVLCAKFSDVEPGSGFLVTEMHNLQIEG